MDEVFPAVTLPVTLSKAGLSEDIFSTENLTQMIHISVRINKGLLENEIVSGQGDGRKKEHTITFPRGSSRSSITNSPGLVSNLMGETSELIQSLAYAADILS